jgi:two-component system NarL family response regulator
MLHSKVAIRVLIYDIHPVVRFGLRHLLNDDPAITVVGDAGDMEEFDRLLDQTRPDVLLVDPGGEESKGPDVLRRMCGRPAHCRVIIYTTGVDRSRIIAALELGVSGYLLKENCLEGLLDNIHTVHEGNAVLDPSVTNTLVGHLNKQTQPKEQPEDRLLSGREYEVLRCLARGMSNRVIANSLYVCEATVKFHVRAILEKLNAGNRTEAVMLAVQRGLVHLCAAAFYAGALFDDALWVTAPAI